MHKKFVGKFVEYFSAIHHKRLMLNKLYHFYMLFIIKLKNNPYR
jgi:hypothetical protein